MSDEHFVHSSHREILIEHLFVGEVLKCLWLKGVFDVEVLKSETDQAGYDVILEVGKIVRHVQLKASHQNATASSQKLNINLMNKPSGCVVWVVFNKETLQLGPFMWFGELPGKPLKDISEYPVAKHTKGNSHGTKAERPNIRKINKGGFEKLNSIEDVVNKLFGI